MINSIFNFVRKMLDKIYIKNKYIPADKQRHFLSGAIGSLILFIFIGHYSILIISVLAISKEISDYFHKDIHTPDFFDWIATTSGAILSVIFL